MTTASSPWVLRNAAGAVLTLPAGVALVAGGVFAVAVNAPDGARDLRAYEAAPRCPAAPAAPAECRWTREFTASGVSLSRKRNEPNRAVLTGAEGVRWETSYSSDGPVLNRLDEGDRVTGTVWRGRLTEISAGGASQLTQDAPADMRARALILALIIVPPGLLLTAGCLWRLFRAAPTPGMTAVLGLAGGLFFGGLFSPLPFAGQDERFWPVAAVWLPVALVMTAVARACTVRKRASN